jgi:uncharacterized membrane protein YuzA (DUF378 family)
MATFTEKRHIMDRRSTISGNISSKTSNRSMSAIDWLAMTLLIIGGINWGLIGLFNFDLVATLFGEMTTVSRLVYVLVGLSALYSIYTASKMSNHT